jgi:uncharacterized integral membrane protein
MFMEPKSDKSTTTTNRDNMLKDEPKRSKIGTVWLALIAFVVVLLLLLIFILQNSENVKIKYFGASGRVGFGVAMLLSAVAGSILTLLIGSARIIQLKMAGKHQKDNVEQK